MRNATRKECLYDTIYSREDQERTKISFQPTYMRIVHCGSFIEVFIFCLFVAWVQSMVKLPSIREEAWVVFCFLTDNTIQ